MTDDERAHAIVAHLCDHGDTGKHDEICVSISAALPAARARSEEAVKDEELGRNVRALVEASPNGYGIGFSRDGIGYQLQRADGTYVEHADGIDFASLDAAVAAARRGQ